MKKIKMKFKKDMTKLLAFVMIASMSQNLASMEQVMASNGAKSYSFVEKTDLIDLKEGKIIFGKNEEGKAQEWYLVGADSKVSGENVVIVAAKPIKASQVFENEGKRNKKDSTLWKDCSYENSSSITEVHPNHYGASDLRAELKRMLNDTAYFSAAEKNLLNATKVSNEDTRNRVKYTTTDKLYLLANVNGELKAGSSDSIKVKVTGDDFFWLRTANGLMDNKGDVLTANAKNTNSSVSVEFSRAIVPVSNLNVSNVLFASVAPVDKSGELDENAAMILRMDGSQKTFGNAKYDKDTGNIAIEVDKSAKNPISVVMLGDDWSFSKRIEKDTVMTTEMIQDALNIKSDVSLDKCKIWVEETDATENLTYAKMAVEGEVPDTPSSDDEEGGDKPGNPEGDKPGNPEGDKPGNPEGDKPGNPEGDKPGDSEGDKLGDTDSNKPGNSEENKPESSDGDKPSNSEDKNSDKTEGTTTGTGDYAPITSLLLLAVLSVSVIVTAFYTRSKQK